jgi:hypothetical protein
MAHSASAGCGADAACSRACSDRDSPLPRVRAPVCQGTLVSGLGHGLAFLGSQQLVDWVAPESSRGAIFSAFYVFIYLGAALPALGVGFSADVVGFLAAVVTFAVVVGALDLGWESQESGLVCQVPPATRDGCSHVASDRISYEGGSR